MNQNGPIFASFAGRLSKDKRQRNDRGKQRVRIERCHERVPDRVRRWLGREQVKVGYIVPYAVLDVAIVGGIPDASGARGVNVESGNRGTGGGGKPAEDGRDAADSEMSRAQCGI